MHTDKAVLHHNSKELTTLRRTQAVLAAKLDKFQRVCTIYESEHAGHLRAKVASLEYINELEDTIKRIREQHDSAVELQAQAQAKKEELQTKK